MTSLWQNLHNFYVRKFPNLHVSNNFTNRNQNDKINGINEIDGIKSKNGQNLENLSLENLELQTQNSVEESQITELWEDLYPRVYGYFMRRISNQSAVEELTSLVLSSFLINVQKSIVEKDNFGYLWQIARNNLFEYCRQKSKNPISLSSFDENQIFQKIDQKLINYQNELICKIQKCAKICLKSEEFALFCDYYESDLYQKNNLESNLKNSSKTDLETNLKTNLQKEKTQENKLINNLEKTSDLTFNSSVLSENLADKYNLKPAALRQKIHRIKQKLQQELGKEKNLLTEGFSP